MRILAISSQVAFGPVGNSAAVPALQAKGHEVLGVPTISLSNHPGLGRPAGLRAGSAELAAILIRLEKLGALESCAAVMTGYFADASQVRKVARLIVRMKKLNPSLFVLVDPVIGDDGKLYVPQTVAEAIHDALVPLASCLTPNRFELEWLTGMPVLNRQEAIAAARTLNLPEVLATSIPVDPDRLATLAVMPKTHEEIVTALRGDVPHGTGDFLAGLYLAERLEHPPSRALKAAMVILERAIKRSAGSSVLNVAGALHGS